jgi:serine/arginine repetitive matrix protein 2
LPRLPDALDHVQTVPNEELEVVDFTEFGRFVGGKEPPAPNDLVPTAATQNISSRKAAASGALNQSSTGEKASAAASSSSSWRRNSIASRDRAKLSDSMDHGPQAHHYVHLDSRKHDPETPTPFGKETTTLVTSNSSNTEAPLSTDHGPPQRVFSNQGHPRSQRPPFYKEPAMSALDDAMSRIKGAIDGMQSSDHARERRTSFSMDGERQSMKHSYNAPSARLPPPGESRWVPPAIRALRQQDPDLKPPDPPDVLSCEPPLTEPADPVIRLPSMSNTLEPLSRRQSQMLKAPPAPFRMDILCWEPPVESLSRRTLSINDVLFGKPFSDKGRGWKYKVVLPQSVSYTETSLHILEVEGPRVNLPPNATMRFAKSAGRVGAASSGTWRRPTPSPRLGEAKTLSKESALNTTSRSPPPETPSTLDQEKPLPKVDATPITQRLRSPPKMPEGSGVAFYRGSRIDSLPADSHSLVNFIVGSELDDAIDALQVVPPAPNSRSEPVSVKDSTSDVSHTGDPIASDIRSQPPSPESAVASLVPNATESKGFDEPVGFFRMFCSFFKIFADWSRPRHSTSCKYRSMDEV